MPSTLPSNVLSMRMYSASREEGYGSRPTPPGRPLQELSTANRPVNAVPAASSVSSRGRATGARLDLSAVLMGRKGQPETRPYQRRPDGLRLSITETGVKARQRQRLRALCDK